MNALEVYPSNYLKAEDIPGPMTVTIEGWAMEKMHDKTGAQIEKPCVSFSELPKSLVTNKTNWKKLIELFGTDTDQWAGKRVTIVTIPVDAFGETVDAIRLMAPKAKTARVSEQQILAELGYKDEQPAVPEPPSIEPQIPG